MPHYYIEAETGYGPRQELWAHSEDDALDLIRALLREDAAVGIVQVPEDRPATWWPFESPSARSLQRLAERSAPTIDTPPDGPLDRPVEGIAPG